MYIQICSDWLWTRAPVNLKTKFSTFHFVSFHIKLTQTSPLTTTLKIVWPRKNIELEETRRSKRVDYILVRQFHNDYTREDYRLDIRKKKRFPLNSIICLPLTFKRKTMRQTKTCVFCFRLTRCVQWTRLMMIFQIGHFTTEQRH